MTMRLGLAAPGEQVSRRGLAGLAVLVVVVFSLRFDNFFTTSNGLSVAVSVSSLVIASCGATWLLIAGYVDLSIGSMYGLIAMMVALVARDGQSTVGAVVVGLAAGTLLGVVNGTLVRKLPVNPLIVTLGLLLVYRGLAFALGGGVAVFGFPDSFVAMGRARPWGIPVPVLVAAAVFVVSGFVLTRSVSGLRTYAIGGNRDAARRHGIATEKYVVALYAYNGLLVGLVAVLVTSRLGSGTPSLGSNFELDVLTAVILGGIAFNGGAGRPAGVLAGIALIGVMNAGLVFMGASDEWNRVAKGVVLLLALFADQYGSPATRWLRSRRDTTSSAPQSAPLPVEDEGLGVAVLERGSVRSDEVSTTAPEAEIVRCQDVEVRFGAVEALRGVDFAANGSEVVCLVGDNGAGKSTLIGVLSGAIVPNAGSTYMDGHQVTLRSPAEARQAGIETVYQDLALFPNLGVTHNLVLGNEPRRGFLRLFHIRDDETAEQIAASRLSELGIQLPDYRTPVKYLSGGQRQAIAIASALTDDLKVLILDEPTAALGVMQTRTVLGLARSIATKGAAVIVISHDVETVFAIADRVVVLRLGKVVYDGPADDLEEAKLLALMAGLSASRDGAADGVGGRRSALASRPVVGKH